MTGSRKGGGGAPLARTALGLLFGKEPRLSAIAWRWAFCLVLVFSVLTGCRREFAIPDVAEEPSFGQPRPRPESASAEPSGRAAEPIVAVTPSPTPTRVPPEMTATTYTVRPGDTLLRIAALYGTTVESLVRLNQLNSPDQIAAGQVLRVSREADKIGPGDLLIPDSELVYGPSYADFDTRAEVERHAGLLADYSETVDGQVLSGSAIVTLVAQQYSVGPRVLLTLLEQRGEWLSNANPSPTQRQFPLGYTQDTFRAGLYRQLSVTANALNGGFYGWWEDTLWLIQTRDGAFIQFSPDLNAGTAGIQKVLAETASDYEAWMADLTRFSQLYSALFGDPFDYAIEPLIPPQTTAPTMVLPWAEDETWYYTGGPHPGLGTQGAFAAVDFVTGERHLGCAVSQGWVTAVAPGLVVVSDHGMVLQDLDGDGFLGTGWVVLYLHIATQDRVSSGVQLQAGDRIGHPSCEGGYSSASHLHLARRLNGVWIATDDPTWPMSLSGWVPVSTDEPYRGTLQRGDEVRTACECWESRNAVTH